MAIPSKVKIRVGEAVDRSEIIRCVESAYAPYSDVMGTKPAPMLDDYASLLQLGRVWIVELNDDLAGLIVMWAEKDHWYVHNIAVDPIHHGEGIGTALLQVADQSARRMEQSEIRLYTNEAMTSNLNFYPRRGFIETHRAVDEGYRRIYYSRAVRRAD